MANVSYGCLLKHDPACIFRVCLNETCREKHNHPVDDEDIKDADQVHFGLADSAFFCRKIIKLFADVKLKASCFKNIDAQLSTAVFIRMF